MQRDDPGALETTLHWARAYVQGEKRTNYWVCKSMTVQDDNQIQNILLTKLPNVYIS